ncbi:MAG: IclR family transcriptional regulator [Bradyrhizobium sp.]|uniref:IclR family transcriptional regulator n=1 Tax=Bradyrhizobium sp. TaxID=376 RepID=UPI001D386D58|nr:IclR family transcriptional regulator [Bradyrhizobium sp.]MBV9564658.1 IclR family transcriptional regulator [Bradyrhizobium sp.]
MGDMDMSGAAPRQGAQAIRRALAVLRILAAGREIGLPLAEVVQATGLTRPTVHRIVHALVEEGVVEWHEKTRRYAIGRQVGELALARTSRSPLLAVAGDILAQTSRRVGDMLFLTLRTGSDTLCVDRRIGSYPIQVLSIEVGARRPLGVSSAGVAILAGMTGHEARKIVATNQTRFEAYRTDTATVLAQIAAARRRGYNFREAGLVQGTKSISTWIKAFDGRPTAALTVSAVRARLTPRRETELAEILLDAARAIERKMQAAGP